jgi:hypothetical protein
MMKVEFGLSGLQIIYAASLITKDDSYHAYGRCVLIQAKQGRIKVAATDGSSMLAFYDRQKGLHFECEGEEGEILIPAKKFIFPLWKERKHIEIIRLVVDDEKKATLDSGVSTYHWEAEADYNLPDYERIIHDSMLDNKNEPTSVICIRAQHLERALKVFRALGETNLQFKIPSDPLLPVVVSTDWSPISIVIAPALGSHVVLHVHNRLGRK